MPKGKSRATSTKTDAYVKFIRSVHLSALGMDSATFKVDRQALASEFPAADKVSAEASGSHELVNLQEKSFTVLGHYTVSVKGPSGVNAAEVSCTFSALFSLDEPTDESYFDRFMGSEVRLVFWPYLRHFVSDATYRMAIYPLILPLTSELKISEKKEGKRK